MATSGRWLRHERRLTAALAAQLAADLDRQFDEALAKDDERDSSMGVSMYPMTTAEEVRNLFAYLEGAGFASKNDIDGSGLPRTSGGGYSESAVMLTCLTTLFCLSDDWDVVGLAEPVEMSEHPEWVAELYNRAHIGDCEKNGFNDSAPLWTSSEEG